jgi:HD superfamily phosphodiesterase
LRLFDRDDVKIESVASLVESVAAIAQEFAAAFGVPNDLAHIAAILHDLGRMGLLAAHPTEYTQLALAAHNTEADDLMFQAIRHEGPRDPVATIEACAPKALRRELTDRVEAAKVSALNMIQSLDF